MAFLRLIRFKNLILLLLALLFTRYLYSKNTTLLVNFHFFNLTLFITSILLIAAAGNIINDIMDVETDKINKPNTVLINKVILKKSALKWYFSLNLSSLLIASYLSYKTHDFSLLFIYLATTLALYFYSVKLKGTPLLGNILIAVLTPLPILILAYFDISNSVLKTTILKTIISIYTIGFLLNFIRELVKDIQDYKGDKKQQISTFTVTYGIKKTLFIIKLTTIFTIISLQIILFYVLKTNRILAIYLFVSIQIPLIYIFLKTTKNNAKKISFFLKITMLFGLFSLLLIS